MRTTTARRGLRCRLGWHRWQTQHNEEGGRYARCSRCGREEDAGARVTAAGG